MNVALLVLIVAGFLGAVSLVATPLWRSRGPSQRRRGPAPRPDGMDSDVQFAAEALREIESEFSRGDLARDEYEAERRGALARFADRVKRDNDRIGILDRAIEERIAATGTETVSTSVVQTDVPTAGEYGGAVETETASRRSAAWISIGGLVAVAFVAVVIVLVSSGRASVPQEPVAELVLGDYRALAAFGGRAIDGLLLGHGSGLEISTDGGRTWSRLPTLTLVNSVAVSPGIIYAGGEGLFSTTDPLSTWDEITPEGAAGDIGAIAVSPLDSATITVLDGDGNLFLSTNGGSGWERLSIDAPRSTRAMAMMPDRGLIYLGTTDQGVLAGNGRDGWGSANGFVNGALPTINARAIAYDARSGDSFEGVNGIFTGALYAGTVLGLFKSVDGGQSWNRLPLAAQVQAVAISRRDPNVITVVDNRGRVFRSADRGLSWDFGTR